MRIAVTGANGFIGPQLCPYLQEQLKADIITLTRSPSTIGNKALSFSVSDEQLISDLSQVDCLIHLAARAHSNATAADLDRDNLALSERVAKLALAAKVARVIYISSIKVNGDSTQDRAPFTADETPQPDDDYGRSKLASELILKRYFANTPTELVIIRPPLVYGSNNKGNLKSLEKLIRLGLPLPFANLNNQRDLVSIENLCALISLTVAHPHAANQIFLVSDGISRNTKEIVELLAKYQNRQLRFFKMPNWVFAVLKKYKPQVSERLTGNLQVDITKTRSFLDWSPVT
ncbi:MAG TPA: NAD-dependent epimerase/dehydratase family protein [Cellvibrio sp.]|nr:NAD-dependent epimerase/dehydratase family protein [Cellvibrio sp.]